WATTRMRQPHDRQPSASAERAAVATSPGWWLAFGFGSAQPIPHQLNRRNRPAESFCQLGIGGRSQQIQLPLLPLLLSPAFRLAKGPAFSASRDSSFDQCPGQLLPARLGGTLLAERFMQLTRAFGAPFGHAEGLPPTPNGISPDSPPKLNGK